MSDSMMDPSDDNNLAVFSASENDDYSSRSSSSLNKTQFTKSTSTNSIPADDHSSRSFISLNAPQFTKSTSTNSIIGEDHSSRSYWSDASMDAIVGLVGTLRNSFRRLSYMGDSRRGSVSYSMKFLAQENSLNEQLESIDVFVKNRLKYKNARYNSILYVAVTCIITGAVLILIMFYVGGTGNVDKAIYNNVDSGFLNIVGHVGIFLGSVGLTTMSLIPPKSMKIDKLLRKPVIICLNTIVTVGSGFILGIYPPYTGFVLCLGGIGVTIVSILKCYDANQKYDITRALSIWLVLFLNVLWPIFFYMGANPSKFFCHRLLYDDTKIDHEYLQTIGYLLGSYYLFMGALLGVLLSKEIYQLHYEECNAKRSAILSAILLKYCLYSFISIIGLSCIVGGVTTMSISTGYLKFGGLVATLNGIIMLLPVVLVIIVGPVNLFSYLEKFFQKIDAIEDGAYIAEIVAGKDYSLGSLYFTKRDVEDVRFSEGSSRRYFYKGKIVKNNVPGRLMVLIDLEEDKKMEDWNIAEFVNQRNNRLGELSELSSTRARPESSAIPQLTPSVDVENPGEIVETNSPSKGRTRGNRPTISRIRSVPSISRINSVMAKNEDFYGNTKNVVYSPVSVVTESYDNVKLRAWAEEHLRYIEWEQLNEHSTEIFSRSPRDSNNNKNEMDSYFLNLSKKRNNEFINYFISHSWSDDPKDKITCLSKLVDAIGSPSSVKFWLDKVCIDQAEQQKALQVLPIHIAYCDKVLVLFGESYLSRLWCVWELYTVFVVSNDHASAMNKIILWPILKSEEGNLLSNDLSERREHQIKKLIEQLSEFSLDKCHCWDPNEEYNLRKVIDNVSVTKFETTIKNIGKSMIETGEWRKILVPDEQWWSKLIPISPGTKQIKKKNSMSIELEAANTSKDNNVI